MNNITLKIVTPIYKSFECECCGLCQPEGLSIYYNEELIWEKYSDDHYSSHQTEDSIKNTILNKWQEHSYAELLLAASEEKRNNYNLTNPGNYIARTPESWAEYHNSTKEYKQFSGVAPAAIHKSCQILFANFVGSFKRGSIN